MRRPAWKKADAKTALETIAQEMAQAFNVPAPAVFIPDYLPTKEWEWRFETVNVWTKAGAAELNVSISDHFAHMYFRFDDPKRAIPFDNHMGRLNRHSGKWNSLETPPHELRFWVDDLKHDFAKVAEPNPDADELAVWRVRKVADAEKWEAYRRELVAREVQS